MSDVATNAGLHQVFSADLHVLLEKPSASTVDEAVEVLPAERGADRDDQPDRLNSRRSAPRQARLVADGAIGDVFGIEIDFRRPRFRRREWVEAHCSACRSSCSRTCRSTTTCSAARIAPLGSRSNR